MQKQSNIMCTMFSALRQTNAIEKHKRGCIASDTHRGIPADRVPEYLPGANANGLERRELLSTLSVPTADLLLGYLRLLASGFFFLSTIIISAIFREFFPPKLATL